MGSGDGVQRTRKIDWMIGIGEMLIVNGAGRVRCMDMGRDGEDMRRRERRLRWTNC
jgi:hypothetical protein